ncbi:hypothetical protein [Spirosoma foliorum]|uniref:Uncharacterized protein n=1 Tax=Spirosoma foliorum TaxID=2710596 RepID=A0A7G5H5K3_9BACT|nr:hypothetical protein [Spirosoma foliorum]QMW06395.1 hypothetical protein H3H32_16630 [Spirosoma foliorum]
MTIQELDTLPLGATIYLPTDWDVQSWQWAGKVPNRNFYTLLHPPDQDGVITNRRPYIIDAMQLMNATLDEASAWLQLVEWLMQRHQWIYNFKLSPVPMDANQPESSAPKSLADYPLIAQSYVKMTDHWLGKWREEMASRTARSVTPWDPTWAHLHLEAIDQEIEKRKQEKTQ